MARTDALQPLGYEESIHRLKLAREAGADVCFLEGLHSHDEMHNAIRDLSPAPTLLNLLQNGATPKTSYQEAKDMGFKVVILSLATLMPAYVSMRDSLKRLKKLGVMDEPPPDVTPKKIFEVCGLEDFTELDKQAGGGMFNGKNGT
jgi:methylisocitrate lyase